MQDGGLKPAATQVKPGLYVCAALVALRLYKAFLSPLLAGSCRFEPTCSRYAYEAIERFGLARGAWLALRRLLRCHPLSRRFGFDPVPEFMENNARQSNPAATSARAAAVVEPCAVATNEVRS